MLASLRRIYLYTVASFAFIFTAFVLENVLYTILIDIGIKDFSDQTVSGTQLSQSLAFLAVDLVIIAPLGALHYWFIRRDERQDPKAMGGVVRQLYLDGLVINSGLLTTIFAGFLGFTVFTPDNYHPYAALYLSVALAWGAALAMVVLERQRARDQLPVARGISLTLGYLTQFGLLIGVVSYASFVIQQILDSAVQAAPLCDGNFYASDFTNSTACQNVSAPAGSLLGMLIALLLGLAGFMLWTRNDKGSIFRQLGDIAFLLVGAITAIIGVERLAYLILSLVTGTALVGWPLALVDNNLQNLTFAGTLVAGGVALAFYLVRTWRTPSQGMHPQQGKQLAIIALAVPLAFTFLVGLIILVTSVFQKLHGDVVVTQQWNGGASFAIAGIAWVALWPYLARMSDPRGAGPAVPRRVYVFILLGATLIGAAVSLATGLYDIITALIGAAVENSASMAETAFAGALVLGVTAGYYVYVLMRDQRVLRERANLAITPEMVSAAAQIAADGAPDPLEALLREVAAGQLPVPEAARQLRDRFGAI